MAARRRRLTGAALAESNVKPQRAEGATVYSLPVNPGFGPPNIVDQARGVEYPGAIENTQAEQGIARAVMKALQPANLQGWIRGQVKRKGGANNVARSLLAMDTPNATHRQYRAMLRKVEEWGQGKYKSAARANAKRVALLRLREGKHLVIGARGVWLLPDRSNSAEEEERYHLFMSDPREARHVQWAIDALATDGEGFIAAVIEVVGEIVHTGEPELLRTHELRVEVSPA